MRYVLWIVQALLALLFLFAGGTKLVLPLDVLAAAGSPNQIQLPGLLIRLVGVAEVLGGLGLVLPALLRIKPGLTPLAAVGLTFIMLGAVTLTIASGEVAQALVPLITAMLLMFVAYGRWRLAPLPARGEN